MNRQAAKDSSETCQATEIMMQRLSSGKKLPWLARRHIDSCTHCQAELLHVNFDDVAFGRKSRQLKRRWNGSAGRKPGSGFLWNETSKLINVAGTPLHALFLVIVVLVTLSAIYRCNP
jgi:hypothetical protein